MRVRLRDGRALQVLDLGDPHGRPVLFLPGCPDSRWAAQPGEPDARRLGVRLVAVNRPGYGASDAAASTHPSVADDLVDLADALGLDRVALLGMSFGGPYAVACAARHPARVSRLVTVAAPADVTQLDPPHHRDGLDAAAAAELARVREAPTVELAMEVLRPGFDAWRAGLTAEARDQEALRHAEGYLRDAALGLRPWQAAPADVRCPVQVRHGELDAEASPRNAVWLAARLPAATLHLEPRATHLAALHEHWAEILGWLAQDG